MGIKGIVRVAVATAVLSSAFAIAPARAADPPFAECLGPDVTSVTVGAVECQRIRSSALGAEAPFSYYVPPACDPTLEPAPRCPTLYLTHGTGGSYRSGLGAKGAAGVPAIVKALTFRPPADPATHDEPWTLTPEDWVPATPLPFVLVAAHNRTLPGGYGPAGNMEGLWSDWNPRYAQGGDQELYATPPPRFETFFTQELLPFVERTLGVGSGRGYRATFGHSQGGFGALKFPLVRPDLFAVAGSSSGGSLPFGKFVRLPGGAVGIQPPAPVPHVPLPGVTPRLDYPPESGYLVIPSLMPAYGDPVADASYYQGEFPSAITENGRAFKDGQQAVAFRMTVGDAIPRRAEDITEGPQGYAASQGYEILTHAATREMARALDLDELDYTLQIRPGIHNGPYNAPYYRTMLEFAWDHMLHPDGSGHVVNRPDRFDFRTTKRSFTVWGWHFAVDRDANEFLNLTDVSCSSLTLRGTGVVTVKVPGFCHTGLDGDPTFTVDLGPGQVTDEPHHVGAHGLYGRTVTVPLTRR